jgi:hypothetical protein
MVSLIDSGLHLSSEGQTRGSETPAVQVHDRDHVTIVLITAGAFEPTMGYFPHLLPHLGHETEEYLGSVFSTGESLALIFVRRTGGGSVPAVLLPSTYLCEMMVH